MLGSDFYFFCCFIERDWEMDNFDDEKFHIQIYS